MVDVLKQFSLDPLAESDIYSYGEVILIKGSGVMKIKTTSGLELTVRDTSQVYAIGDQVVLGKKDGTLNSVFIIRKIDRICKSAVNVVISNGQG
jgi:hypothetical protein